MNAPKSKGAAGAVAPPEPRDRNILIADDERLVTRSLGCLIKSLGYCVEVADDGDAAFDKIQRAPWRYQLLITDHSMMTMGGLELVERLNQLGYPGKIVVYSGFLSRKEAETYRALGVQRILIKPATQAEMHKVIQELIGCAAG
jgi:two-component system response regulator YesN